MPPLVLLPQVFGYKVDKAAWVSAHSEEYEELETDAYNA
jgi:hypothetical protein